MQTHDTQYSRTQNGKVDDDDDDDDDDEVELHVLGCRLTY